MDTDAILIKKSPFFNVFVKADLGRPRHAMRLA